MVILGNVTLAIAGVLVIFSGILLTKHFPYAGLWIGCAAAVFGVLGAAANIHVMWAEKDGSANDRQADLSADIENLTAVITFNKPIPVMELREKDFLVRLHKHKRPWGMSEIEIAVRCSSSGMPAGREDLSMDFAVATKRNVDRAQMGFCTATTVDMVKTLAVPITAWRIEPASVNPFLVLRELDGFSVDLITPPEISPLISRVEILANANEGFKRGILLLAVEPDAGEWQSNEIDIKKNMTATGPVKAMACAGATYGGAHWRIEANDAAWVTREIDPRLEKFRFGFK